MSESFETSQDPVQHFETTEDSQSQQPIPAVTQETEEDLFGSDEETQQPIPASSQTQEETVEEEDLFGDVEEEEIPQQTGGDGIQDEDLFGSGDEEAPSQGAGDDDDDNAAPLVPRKTKKFRVHEGEALSRDVDRVLLKLPNVLGVDPNPFNPEKFDPGSKIAFREVNDLENHRYVMLENAENMIRFRFQQDKKGGNYVNSNDGRRVLMESNARFVEWEDGSYTIHVGKEAFRVKSKEDPVHVYEKRSKNLSTFQQVVDNTLIVTPMGLNTETHQRLKNSQINKVKPSRKIQLQLHGPEAEKRRREVLGIVDDKAIHDAARPKAKGKPRSGQAERAAGITSAIAQAAIMNDTQPVRGQKRTAEEQAAYDEEHGVSLRDLKKR